MTPRVALEQMALLELYRKYIVVTKALSPNTVEAYLYDLTQLLDCTQIPFFELDTSRILSYLSTFDNHRTLNRKLSSINSFFEFCHKEEYHDKSIDIPMSKIPQNLPKYLSSDKILSAVDKIDRSTLLGKRDYALILFLYASGCRVSEALGAHRSDLLDGWLKILYAKGQKQRVVPIAPIAIKAIEEYLSVAPPTSKHIWLNYRAEPLSRISAYKIVKKYLGVSPHALRHSFASALISGGADLRVVQELLGHSSLVTTQIYTHIEDRSLEQTIQRYHPLRRAS